jgi:TolB-like protein
VTDHSRAVFLSYASEDVDAAQRIALSLEAAGIEAWFDRNELRGGDKWDQKIRRQVQDCALFIAVISAHTEQRREGYFRLEWNLAVDRSQMMADDTAFLIPVVIDGTTEAAARVPDRFRQVQWMHLPEGHVPPRFVEHLVALLQGDNRIRGQVAMARTASKPSISRRGTQRGLLLGAILLVTIGVGWASWRHIAGDATHAENRPVSHPRIAVLPFENLSPDVGNAFFAEGVHEELLTTLANNTPGLDVISSTTMAVYRGKPVQVPTLAQELHCNYVLEGSVRREGNLVRLTLQLIDARDDRQIWSESYDRTLGNAMVLEREVAVAVSSRLALKLSNVAQGHVMSADPAAYDLYLQGKAAERSAFDSGSVAGIQTATQLLDQAIAADPNFVGAHLERMSLRLRLFLRNYALPDEVLPLAQEDLAAAQRLAPSDPVVVAHAAVMAFATLDYDRALRLFESAEHGGVADPDLLDWKRLLLFAMGRYPEAAAVAARLADLDPKNEGAQDNRVYMLMELHQYREALHLVDALGAGAPADWEDERNMVLGYAGGNFAPRHAALAGMLAKPWRTAEDVQSNFFLASLELSLQHRFDELRRLIDQSPIESWRCTYHMWPLYRAGRMPVADERGWVDLMSGNRVEARRDGDKILSFLRQTPETAWNKWFRTLLQADAELFMGDTGSANRTAAAAVDMTRTRPDVSDQMDAYVWSTEILAWTERKDEVVARLTALSIAVPGLWPGEILVDPRFSLPLAGNAAYRSLSDQLTREMRALDLK